MEKEIKKHNQIYKKLQDQQKVTITIHIRPLPSTLEKNYEKNKIENRKRKLKKKG